MTTRTIGTDVLRYLEALWQPGEVREVRIPRHNRFGHTASGYFSSPAAAAEAVAAWDGQANVYVTLNPVDPALRARAAEHIVAKAEHTSADVDVTGRRWLLVDVDPVRPAGVSSTDGELAGARAVLDTAVGFLTAQGWPEPLVALSGNGYHALYRVDLPNDAESLALVQGVLTAVAEQADTAAAKVDPTVANASRITALIGTLKMKGDSIPERPHRRSRVERLPDLVDAAPLHFLTAVAALSRPAATPGPTLRVGLARAHVTTLLDRAGLPYREQPPDAAGITWYHLERCPFHDDGRRFECGVGEALDGRFTGKCFHPEGSGKGWHDFKAALGLGGIGIEVTNDDQASVTADSVPTGSFFNRTDAGNGEHFARKYGDLLRFDHRRQRWLIWAGHWWRDDNQGEVRRLAKDAARDRYQRALDIDDLRRRADEARFAVSSENRQRIEAMLLAARSEAPIADAGVAWNADPWLLGVRNGIVDLRTGSLRPGHPEERTSFHTQIAFDAAAACPRWDQFLDEVFGGDRDVIDFIGRAVGYSLTGDTREQCLFTCHGSGSNGKSTFLKVLRDLAGDYGANTPFSTFELHSRSAIPNDLAALAERRLVTASETAEGTRLNEGRMKALTGGDEITARFLHGEFFSFRPAAKFWLAVNHKPRVADDSHGFWRRVRLIPFLRRFTDDGDRDLPAKLDAELPGILAWAVRGALAWQAEGLRPPAAVTNATETYRVESDPLSDFLEAGCLEETGLEVGAASVFRAYQSWAADQGLSAREQLTATAFGRRFADRFANRKTKAGRVYVGIGLAANRPGPSSPPVVTGLVTGSDQEGAESGISPWQQANTRENVDSGVTTRPRLGPPGQPRLCGPGRGRIVLLDRQIPCLDTDWRPR